MTTKQKAEEIKEAVFKACPELLDLSFGCKFEWNNTYSRKKEIYSITAMEFYSKKEFTVICVPLFKLDKDRSIEDCYKFDERILLKPFEILGHPITIAEILRTINLCYTCYKSLDSEYSLLVVYDDIRFVWDLKNNSLDYHIEHHPETIYFLYSLIVKK